MKRSDGLCSIFHSGLYNNLASPNLSSLSSTTALALATIMLFSTSLVTAFLNFLKHVCYENRCIGYWGRVQDFASCIVKGCDLNKR